MDPIATAWLQDDIPRMALFIANSEFIIPNFIKPP